MRSSRVGNLSSVTGSVETRPAFVEKDQATERCEAIKETSNAWLFPQVLDVRNPAMNEDEIDGSLAGHLVGNMNIAALRVLSFRNHRAHAPSTLRSTIVSAQTGILEESMAAVRARGGISALTARIRLNACSQTYRYFPSALPNRQAFYSSTNFLSQF